MAYVLLSVSISLGIARNMISKAGQKEFSEFFNQLKTNIAAACIASANKLNLYLSGILDGIIFFRCVNGGYISLSALFSKLIFKERLSCLQWAGIAGSIAAIMLITLK